MPFGVCFRAGLSVVVLCSLSLATAGSAAAKDAAGGSAEQTYTAQALPTMWAGDAKYYARQTLKWRFQSQFEYGQGKRISCRTRISRTKRRCKVRWGIGDLSFRGRVTPFYSYRGSDPWYARYNVLRINEYCRATGGSWDRCTKRYRGTY